MGNVNGTGEAAGTGNPGDLMQLLQMIAERKASPWEAKAQAVCHIIREGGTESVQNAIKEFESVQARAFLVRILVENNDDANVTAVLNQVFPEFLREVRIISDESEGMPVVKALKACLGKDLFSNEISDHIATLYAGNITDEQLPLLASTTIAVVKLVKIDIARRLTTLFLNKVDWANTTNSGVYALLAELLHLTAANPVFQNIFNECWAIVEATSRRQSEDDISYLAITSIIRDILSAEEPSTDLLIKLFTVLIHMPDNEKRIECISVSLLLGMKVKNTAFLRSVLAFPVFTEYPLEGPDAIMLYSSALSGSVIATCHAPNDNVLVRNMIRSAFLAATVAEQNAEVNLILQPITHLIDAHSEFIPYILEELTTMYKSNSVSICTTGIFATLAVMALTKVATQESLVTDAQIASVIQAVLDTPNPWVFAGTKATIGMMIVPVLALKNRLPELCDRYMDWVRANIVHIKIMEEQLRNIMNSANEVLNDTFKERLTEFLKLM